MVDCSKHLVTAEMKSRLIGAHVVDIEGRRAEAVSVDTQGADATVTVHLDQGPNIALPLGLLSIKGDDEYHLPVSFAAMLSSTAEPSHVVIPVVQEQLQIDKRTIDAGKGARVHKTVSEHEQVVDQPLLQDELIVEHVPVGEIVAAARLPTTRYDGDTLVVPVFEEVLVVEKQTRLKEEVRITRRKREVHAPQTVFLKSEQVTVERFDEHDEPAGVPRFPNQVQPGSGKPAG